MTAAGRLAPFAIACALFGCGGATHVAAIPRPSPGSSHSAPVTKAQVKAYAHAVNLQATDLPNMRITKGERRETVKRIDRAFAHCLGDTSPRKSFTAIHSPTFTSETEGEYEYELIGSDIEAQTSETIAAEYDAHLRSAHGLDCIRRFASMELAKKPGGVGYAPLTVARISSPLPGVAGSFGYRFKTAVVSLPESQMRFHAPVYIDAFGFSAGQVDVTLTAAGAPGPVPVEAEQRLVSLLYSRAHASSL